MTVYMLRRGDRWYQRRSRCYAHWGEQNRAAVWTTRQGPISAKGSVAESERAGCEIVEFEIKEKS